MERREALRLLLAGAAIPAIPREMIAMLGAARAQIAAGYVLRTLNPHQNATVTLMADLILPDTDTPGAKATKVNEFVDLILTDWAAPEERENFVAGLSSVDQQAVTLFGKSFADCERGQQEAILRELDEMLAVEREELIPHRRAQEPKQKDTQLKGNFFGVLKRLTLYGYYTSEIGFKQELQDVIIPGAYHGCASVTEEKKAPGI